MNIENIVEHKADSHIYNYKCFEKRDEKDRQYPDPTAFNGAKERDRNDFLILIHFPKNNLTCWRSLEIAISKELSKFCN